MNIHQELSDFGLKSNEIKIYILILETGIATPPQIARTTKIARPNVYNYIESLIEKGLIESQFKGKRKAYFAKNPKALIHNLERKKEHIKKILPELSGLYVVPKNKPQIRYFSGPKEIEDIYLMILECKKKVVYAYGGTEALPKIIGEFWNNVWLPGVKNRGIIFRDIFFAGSAKTISKDIKDSWRGLHDYQVIPQKYGDVPTGLLLWDNNIALMNYEEPIFGTVITNKNLAESLRISYEVMWDSLSLR